MEATNTALELLWPLFVGVSGVSLILAVAYLGTSQASFFRRLMIIGMYAAFGATLGTFVGASKDSVLQLALTPVLALCTGFLAIYANKEVPDEIKVLVPGALLAFLVLLLFSAFYMRAALGGV